MHLDNLLLAQGHLVKTRGQSRVTYEILHLHVARTITVSLLIAWMFKLILAMSLDDCPPRTPFQHEAYENSRIVLRPGDSLGRQSCEGY